MKLPQWERKIKRYQIKGRWCWYITEDGGINWRRISYAKAMAIIDSLNGIVLQ